MEAMKGLTPTGKPKLDGQWVEAPFDWKVTVGLNPETGSIRIDDAKSFEGIWKGKISDLPLHAVKALERKD